MTLSIELVCTDSIFHSRQSVLDNLPEHQRRQPQAAPLQPQPANHAGIQQQGENDPIARALGRFARNAAQPPPPATGQQPQGPRNTGAQGWLPGPAPGVVIQYNIQYQGQPPQPQRQSSQTTPQPVPPFAGFIGPDQNWRPWDPDQRCFNREDARAVDEPPTSASNDEIPVPQSSDTPSTGDAPQTPAEAAAQAALRRFGGQFASSSSSIFPSRPASSSPTTSVGAATWSVPSLIPLDRHHMVPTGGALSAPSTSTNHNLPGPSSPNVPMSNPDRLVPTPNMRCSQNVSNGATDAQLALLDQITREAIDERIRILEGVSHTITACVEDLIRVRSALPLPETMPTALPLSSQDATTRDDRDTYDRLCYGEWNVINQT
jgi:E3 ubiquitin-protein ligase synoviolin